MRRRWSRILGAKGGTSWGSQELEIPTSFGGCVNKTKGLNFTNDNKVDLLKNQNLSRGNFLCE